MGFWWVIGFTGLLQIVTTINCKSDTDLHTSKQLEHAVNLLSLLCLHEFSGNSFQRGRSSALVVSGFYSCWLAAISQLTRCCYATAYDDVGSSAPPPVPRLRQGGLCGTTTDVSLFQLLTVGRRLSRLTGLSYCSLDIASARTNTQHRFPQFLYCCMT
jgi:hypothetical protein